MLDTNIAVIMLNSAIAGVTLNFNCVGLVDVMTSEQPSSELQQKVVEVF